MSEQGKIMLHKFKTWYKKYTCVHCCLHQRKGDASCCMRRTTTLMAYFIRREQLHAKDMFLENPIC